MSAINLPNNTWCNQSDLLMPYYVHFSDYSCAPPSELLLGSHHYLEITYHYSPFLGPLKYIFILPDWQVAAEPLLGIWNAFMNDTS